MLCINFDDIFSTVSFIDCLSTGFSKLVKSSDKATTEDGGVNLNHESMDIPVNSGQVAENVGECYSCHFTLVSYFKVYPLKFVTTLSCVSICINKHMNNPQKLLSLLFYLIYRA